MDNTIWVALITGLTAGGLSCMAVQGGLVTSSLANQIEKEMQSAPVRRQGDDQPRNKPRQLARPILLFLLAKLAAYTLLGLLLGGLGSVFSLTPMVRGILQIAIAIFMIGNALRMLNVHPIFRCFSFEPPRFVIRFIRRKSKDQTSVFTPLFMGILTVLIPCGVTQTMMALAIGTGNPLTGAVIMFAFILGTSPVFFILTYLATRLGALAEKSFVKVVAVVLLLLAIFTFDTGLNLLGSPVSLTRLAQNIFTQDSISTASISDPTLQAGVDTGGFTSGILAPTPTAKPSNAGEINLNVTNRGYDPREVIAPANLEVTLNLVTNRTTSCSRAFVIPAYNFSVVLPETGIESVKIPAQTAGTRLEFMCSMGMYTGVIIFQ
jgi:sulfite exporter TauE/SafE